MGFLKFLNKKKELPSELDVPPPLPSEKEDFGLTSIGEEIPPPPSEEEEELPKFPSPVEEELPPMPPEIPKLGKKTVVRKRVHYYPKAKIPILVPEAPPEEEETPIPEAEPFLAAERPAMEVEIQPLFVRAGAFKDVLKSINIVKVNLKKAEDILLRLDDIENNKDREFTKWHGKLTDLQDKMMFVDKILFKQ